MMLVMLPHPTANQMELDDDSRRTRVPRRE